MTLQTDVLGDAKYVPVLDHGFVGLVDHMGSDADIVSAARVSYGNGTKSVREDRGLIRYLVRHKHTSPLEMCEVKLHLKLPIFVMRQLVRHRTSSLNEYSARYSVLTDEMYIPKLENIQPQSTLNKQGRGGEMDPRDAEAAQKLIAQATKHSHQVYQTLLGEGSEMTMDNFGFTEEFPGMTRELARTVMPVAGYTELYWKQNLHNLFHMLKLREDSHAQWEIQEFARAIYKLIQPLFPAACEAYEDYIRDAKTLSGMEVEFLQALITRSNEFDLSFSEAYDHIQAQFETEAEMLDHFRMSKRELNEFKAAFKL
jgi:thymidylate synthase (FAD)